MAALLKFLKGNYASLSTAAIAEGQVLICGDTGEMFVDVAADKRVKIGDYVTVASLEALLAIDPASVPATRLYYVEGANILARSNGTSWDQINKDTGVTSVLVDGEGNAVTTASYDATTRKLTLTKGETFATKAELDASVGTLEDADADILAKIGTVAEDQTVVSLINAAQTAADNAQAAADAAQGEVDALETLVGTVPEGSDTVIAYINKKTQEVLDTATGGSSESAASVKLALDNYKVENDAKVNANTAAAAAAQSKADEAYELAESKATMDEVNNAIANAGHAVASDVNAAIDGINDKIGEVAEGKTVVEMIAEAQTDATYDDTEVRSLISANTQAITKETEDRAGAVSGLKTELEGKINTKVEQDAYDTKVAALESEDTRLAGLIGDNTTVINGVSGKVDTLVGADTGKSVRTIANEELAAQLIPEDAKASLDTLQEIAAWIQAHPDDASAMNAAIEALEAKVDTGEQTVSAYVTAAINALNIGDYATAEALTAAVGRIADLETASATHATKDALQGVADDLDAYKTAHTGDYDNTAIDALVEGVQDQIDALDDTYATDAELESAISAEITRANGAYAAKSYEATVDGHVADTVKHITADERTAWNKVISDLSAHKAAYDTKVSELEAADTAIRGEFAAADTALKTELQGYADQAEVDAIAAAKTETEKQVTAEKTAREQAIAGVQGNIDTVSGALDAYKTANDAAVALKANSADVYTKTEVEAMLTWGEF